MSNDTATADGTEGVQEDEPATETTPSREETELGLTPEQTGALAYLVGVITGALVLIVEQDDEFARFHGAQSIVYSIAVFAVYVLLSIVQFMLAIIPRIGGVLSLLFSLVWLVVWVGVVGSWLFLMYRAYQGDRYRLPVLGNLAENIAS